MLEVLPRLLDVFASHDRDADVMKQALGLTLNMSTLPDNKTTMMQCLPGIQGVFRCHAGTPEVLTQALSALVSLAVNDDNCVPLMAVVPSVVTALQRHEGVVTVARSGIQFLAYLALVPTNLPALKGRGMGPLVRRLQGQHSGDAVAAKWAPVLLGKIQ
jgi:hypothetical protein